MSDLREAAEMALEALEWNYGTDLENIENCMAWLDKMNATIPALRQALAQPEQEPVAWRNAAIRVGEDLCSVGPFGYYDMTAEQWLDWALSVVTVHVPKPKREWVGLTKKDLKPLCDQWKIIYGGYVDEFARAIEAKLKEKNT